MYLRRFFPRAALGTSTTKDADLGDLDRLSMPSAFGGRAPLFLQLQSLQRGASIGAHVDEHDVGGRAIMTAVVAGGGGDVRVGGVSFAVRAGDVYALCGDARDAIDHEVYYSACRADRLSVTVRYGGRSEDPYPFPCEKEAESLPGERRRVSVSESVRIRERLS